MRRVVTCVIALAIASSGCTFGFEGEGAPGSSSSSSRSDTSASRAGEPPAGCDIDQERWARTVALFEQTDDSVHELITCAGMQVTVGQSLPAIVLASNRDLFGEEALREFEAEANSAGLLLETPFEGQGDRWVMPIPDRTDATFTVRFFAPGEERPLTSDPFDLSAYLRGLDVESDYSLETMLEFPGLRNDFTVHWEERGPLAHLLGEEIPNPFTLRFSLDELKRLVEGWVPLYDDGDSFGTLHALLDVETTSEIRFVDTRGGATVEYVAVGRRATVDELVRSERVGFEVRSLTARDEQVELRGRTEALDVVRRGELAGEIVYELADETIDLMARSDFGDGAAYPETTWSCEPK